MLKAKRTLLLVLSGLIWLAASSQEPLFAQADPAAAAARLVLTILELRWHGLAVVVETPNGGTWLIDTGERSRPQYWDARDTVAPFLTAKNVADIAGIVISHPHGDHFGGLPYFVERFRIKQLVDAGYEAIGGAELQEYRKMRLKYIEGGGQHIPVKAGARLSWGAGLEVQVLSPPSGLIHPESGRAVSDDALYNDNSVVLRVRHGKNVFLFPGDIGKLGQDYLLRQCRADMLKAALLVAPHHGFGSYPSFAEAVRPEVVVASCLDDYPKSAVRSPGRRATEIFGEVGAKVYVTPWDGDVEVSSDGVAVHTRVLGQAFQCRFTRRRPPLNAVTRFLRIAASGRSLCSEVCTTSIP
jgi:competence protein ComEC